MRTKSILLAAILSVATIFNASAWGGLGHRTIAEIAERHLTPTAKANIEKYTKGTPLSEYAVWLDWVRKNDPYYAELTDGWHAAIVDENCKTSHELREKHRKGRDAVTVTLMFDEMFRNREKLSDSTVMVALKSVIHMVADFHCPGHVRYTDNNNSGKWNVTYLGKERSIHKIWDTSILTYGHKNYTHLQYADKLDTFTPKQIKKVTSGWLEDWLEESGRVVRPTLEWVKEGDELYIDFVEKAQPLAHDQARKAGYRLAAVLNAMFK